MKLPNITLERVKELLIYDPDSGIFRNRITRGSWALAGVTAGCRHSRGYWKIRLDQHYMLAHRLAWFYVHGIWPEEIDHINRDKCDNRISNLRTATRSQNMINRPRPHISSTGFPGVYRKRNSYYAKIKLRGKSYHLGTFNGPEEASAAYKAAAASMFGRFGCPADWDKSSPQIEVAA